MYNLLIHNARIARPDGSTFEGDVACEDGRIARIDPAITAAARETIDAAGKLRLEIGDGKGTTLYELPLVPR